MMARLNLQGSMVALVTPFRNDQVDEPAFKRLIERQVEGGTSAIVPCGVPGLRLTSLERLTDKRLSLEEVARQAAREFAAVFQAEVSWQPPGAIWGASLLEQPAAASIAL
jgi:dihydrodipicolinate synthase/N-acetylneuraminate lyase